MARKSKAEIEALAPLVVHFYENSGDKSVSKACQHFSKTGVSPKTVRNIVKRYTEEGRLTHNKKSGRIPKIGTPRVVDKVRKLFQNDPNISVRRAADKLGLPRSTVSDIKVKNLGYKAYKKEVAPKYNPDQERRAKRGCRKLYREKLLSGNGKIVVMDDETYCPVDPTQVPGSEYFHCRDKLEVPDKNRFKSKTKFAKKYMVWQCIDELGNVCEPFVSGDTMNAETYKNECLRKRLLPFITQHHRKEDVVVWMDMATCHYAEVCIQFLEEEGIDYVAKADNAPKVPQARPIEKFWSLCKTQYKRRKVGAKSLSSFKRIWHNIARTVAQRSGPALMRRFRGRLRAIAYNGVHAPLRKA